MESGKLQKVDDNFDLYEVIQQTRDILFINVLSKNIDLILIIYSDTPRFVCGDKLRLKQVLLNLIGNAIKFTEEGEVVIKVMVEQQSESDVTILITVEDTGIGISEKDQETLFEAFSQVDTATNHRLTGTGLGLVISKNLLNLMADEISMQSKLGVGTKFSVCLPFLLTSPPAEIDPMIHLDSSIALILSSRKTCLQEITSLFDRAQIATESMLVSDSDSADTINSNIRKNLDHIDFLAIDLRHFNLNLNQILENISTEQTRIIIMHYDQTMIKAPLNLKLDFISTTTNSQNLKKALNTPQNSSLTGLNQVQTFVQTTSVSKLSIDFEQSLKLALNNKIILCKIFDILIRDIPSLQLQLKTAAFQNERERLSAILHKLHGTTCYTSLPRLKQQVSDFQQSLMTCSNSQQQEFVLKIHDELDNIRSETQQWLKDMDNGEEA